MSLKEIVEGHGLTDVSCRHGSRWIWWYDDWDKKGKWEKVVLACNCDCTDPPQPFWVFSCGCMTWKQEDTFFIKPCSENCKVLRITIEESKKRGNILMIKELKS